LFNFVHGLWVFGEAFCSNIHLIHIFTPFNVHILHLLRHCSHGLLLKWLWSNLHAFLHFLLFKIKWIFLIKFDF
jgi:hypothetical protein